MHLLNVNMTLIPQNFVQRYVRWSIQGHSQKVEGEGGSRISKGSLRTKGALLHLRE